MKKKRDATIDRQTALKLTSIGTVGLLLPLLGISDPEPSPLSSQSGSPMNLQYTVHRVVKSGKGQITERTVIQIWRDGAHPLPTKPKNAVLKYSYDGDSADVEGPDENELPHHQHVPAKVHVRVYLVTNQRL